jgi:anti-sigma factor RsiW
LVSRWVAQQLQRAVFVPTLPGAQLRGARLCVMDGRRGAVLEYDVAGVGLSYFVVPISTDTARGGVPLRFERALRGGFHLVAWREPGVLHVMVGGLPESRLATLARVCIEQAHRVASRILNSSTGGASWTETSHGPRWPASPAPPS